MNDTLTYTNVDRVVDAAPAHILDPINRTIDSVAGRLEWRPHQTSHLPENFEDVLTTLLGGSYLFVGRENNFKETDFCWTGGSAHYVAEQKLSSNAAELITEILRSTPSDQKSRIEHILNNSTSIDLLAAAESIGTGSARMMTGSLISTMGDAWTAWQLLSQGRFGNDVISYIGEIFETPEQKDDQRSELLIEIAKNHDDEVKESLLDELAARNLLTSHPVLLEFLQSDDSEVIRNYAQSLG